MFTSVIPPPPPGNGSAPANYDRLSHTPPDQVGEVATQAGARNLVLSRISPGSPPNEAGTSQVATTYNGPVTVAADLQVFHI